MDYLVLQEEYLYTLNRFLHGSIFNDGDDALLKPGEAMYRVPIAR